MIFSLAETCKLNGVNPEAYLRDVVQRIESTLNSDLDSLLHFHWKPRDGSDPVDLNRPILHPNLAAP
ncbi:MAG TPA: transposase domain-containing protein [Azospirillum sp.]